MVDQSVNTATATTPNGTRVFVTGYGCHNAIPIILALNLVFLLFGVSNATLRASLLPIFVVVSILFLFLLLVGIISGGGEASGEYSHE